MIGRRVARTVIAAAVLVTACGSAASRGSSRDEASSAHGSAVLQVAAAASLRSALQAATPIYAAEQPGVTLVVQADSSAALRTKIEQGAAFDLFLAADTKNPQALVDAGLAAGEVTPFAGNLLTVVVPASNPAGIGSPADLARDGVKIVAAGEEVPITGYASELVMNLASQPGYPAGFADAYAANVVSREDNVSAIVAKVALGEGDSGIVYRTDALANPDVVTVDVPAAANVPATYGGIVTRDAGAPDAAAAFLAWLAGPRGQAILAEAGFQPAP